MPRNFTDHVNQDTGHGHLTVDVPSPSFVHDDLTDSSGLPSASPSSPQQYNEECPSGTNMPQASRSQRTKSPSKSGDKAGSNDAKEKRKRSRVTPEQLAHLERLFASDRSPTAARRKEISDLLGMQERQTQIWFQNRRAKAKLFDGKGGADYASFPSDIRSILPQSSDAELRALVQEREPVMMIPCTELSIGTWRRVAAILNPDLIAYMCERQRKLTWFIHSAGQSFKMDISFETIIDTQLSNPAQDIAQASFLLSRPPKFYLQVVDAAHHNGTTKTWKACADWTEAMQATRVLRHDLVGSVVQLAHVLKVVSTSGVDSEVALFHPAYHMGARSPSVAFSQILAAPNFRKDSDAGPSQLLQPAYGLQQPHFSRPPLSYSDRQDDLVVGNIGEQSFSSTVRHPPSDGFSAFNISSEPITSQYSRIRRSSPDDTQQLAISHIAARRLLSDMTSQLSDHVTHQPALQAYTWKEDTKVLSASVESSPFGPTDNEGANSRSS